MSTPYPAPLAQRVDVHALRMWNYRNERAHTEYEIAKADAAQPEGCEMCAKAFWPDDDRAYRWARAGGLFFCGRCINLVTAHQLIADQLAALPDSA